MRFTLSTIGEIMNNIEQKFDEFEGELLTIIDISEFFQLLCNCEYVDIYKDKLYLMANLLKEKCVQSNDMLYDLKLSNNNELTDFCLPRTGKVRME